MRMRRKAERAGDDAATTPTGESAASDAVEPELGPFDVDEVDEGDLPPVDLGSLMVAPMPGANLRVQVEEKTQTVRSVLLTGESGAVELRAYAAPRNGDLWGEIRPQIAADTARRGGTATEREGTFGTELLCEIRVKRSDGVQGTQVSRVVGVNGPRWLLRATFLGDPARQPESAAAWEEAVRKVVVRRGTHAMPVGEQLPITMPEGAQQVQPAQKPPADR